MNAAIKIASALALIAIFISAMTRDNSVTPDKSESEFVKTWPTPSRPAPHSDEWAKRKWGKKDNNDTWIPIPNISSYDLTREVTIIYQKPVEREEFEALKKRVLKLEGVQ